MKLMQLYYEGGSLIMFVITMAALLMLIFSGLKVFRMSLKKQFDQLHLNYILIFGSLALVIGILGQGIGLIQAMDIIEKAGDISPALLAGGFKVSLIAPLYGLIIFLISLIIWVVLKEINLRKANH